MDAIETLGVPAHPGGILVERPELTVGLVRATSSPTGLEVELMARRPPDRRTALQRQADIRAGRDVPAVVARHLLPAYDEGRELRFARLDEHGRAHWSYPAQLFSDSGFSDGRAGPSLRVCYQLPPVFDAGSFVLAWPEIGFPEKVVHLALPDRATVERDTICLWQASTSAVSAPDAGLSHRDAATGLPAVEAERGRSVAAPRLMRRAGNAIVVLTRLTAVGPFLSMEIRSVARGEVAGKITESAFPPREGESARFRHSASVAVVNGADAMWLHPNEATASGGPDAYEETGEYTVERPDSDALDLIVGWAAAGMPEGQLTIPITDGGR
jgi:hypothetical protein